MEENTQKRTENYLLFVPSLARVISKVHYTVKTESDPGEGYDGIQTNEAVTKYLLDELKKNGESLDKIIMLCSKEVMENEINFAIKEKPGDEEPPAIMKTTYEYYCDEIKRYIGDGMGETYEIPEFVQIPYNIEGDNDSNEILKPLQDIVRTTTDGQAESTKRVYVDFSGGLRTSALTLVFACRILESEGLQVEQILYSNLKSTNPPLGLIEDCTNTYYLFDHLAARAQYASDTITNMTSFINKKHKGSKKMLDVVEAYRSVLRAINTNQYEQIVNNGEKLKKKLDAIKKESNSETDNLFKDVVIAANEIKKNKSTIRLFILKNDLRHAERNETAKRDVVTTFRENSALILAETQIIDCPGNIFKRKSNQLRIDNLDGRDEESKLKAKLADEFLGVYIYYLDFVESIRNCCKELNSQIDIAPYQWMVEEYDKKLRNPYTYIHSEKMKDKWWKSVSHKNGSKKICEEYLTPYIKEKQPGSKDVTKAKNYEKLEKIYMLLGYPFACTYKDRFFRDYDVIYKKIFDEGAKKMEAFYQGKNLDALKMLGAASYKDLVNRMAGKNGDNIIAKVFPFELNPHDIFKEKSNSELKDEEKWNDFMYQYGKTLYEVREVRNKVNHRNQLSDVKLDEAVEAIRKIIPQIEKLSVYDFTTE